MPNVSNIVKSIQDIMRKDAGTYGDAQRLEQLGWMFFLKIFDDREKEMEILRDHYKSPLPQNLRWSTWANDAEGITGDALLDFVNNTLLPKLKALTTGGDKIAGLIRMAFDDANNYMKNGTLMRQVINKINGIDFNASDDRHMFGDIYEKLLKDLQSAGNAGEFYTPRAVTQFIVEQVNPRLGEAILDPACGTGGFLTCTIEHLRKQAKTEADERTIQECFAGIEKKHLPHVLCMTNLLLHGIDVPSNVLHDNTLARPLRDWSPKERVDVIVTNPPFGGMEEDGIEANFPSEFRTRETADLFLVLLMKLLKPGGRAGVVLPDGSLTGDGVKQRIRQKLLEECNLHTIVRLPNSVFKPYATVATNMLFFASGSPTKEIWYYQHTCPEGLRSYSKTNPIKSEDFHVLRGWWNSRIECESAWRVGIKELRERNYDLDIKNPRRPIAPVAVAEEFIETLENELKNLSQEINEILTAHFSFTGHSIVDLGALCRIEKGEVPISKAQPGPYPLVTTGEDRKTHTSYQIDGEADCIPIVSSTGHGHASIKRIQYQSGKFAVGNILAAATPIDNNCISAKYLHVYLNHFKDEVVVPLMRGMANVTLSLSSIRKIKILLPNYDEQLRLVDLMEKCQSLRERLRKSALDSELMISALLTETFGVHRPDNSAGKGPSR